MRLSLLIPLLSACAITVLTSPWPPIVYCELGSSDFSSFSGYDMDLLREVAKTLKWEKVEVQCLGWNEMLLGVEEGRADFAMAGINVDTKTMDKVRFSTPTYESGLSLITRIHRSSLIWLSFSPFEPYLWLSLGVSTLLLSHVLWIIERREGSIKLHYFSGILDSLWIVLSALFFSTERKVVTIPGRLIQICMGLCSFLVFAIYIGNLTARLTMPFPSQTISSYKDLGGASVGLPTDYSSILSQFSDNLTLYPSQGQNSSAQIVSALQSDQIQVAALEHPQAVYYSTRECGVTVLDFNFVEIYYAAAFSSKVTDSFIREFSIANSGLKERFMHEALMNKYLNQASNQQCSSLFASDAFTLFEVTGVFAVIVGGISLSFPVFVFQCVYKRQSKEQMKSEHQRMSKAERHGQKLQAEIKLVRKFDKILLSADQKLGSKLEELEHRLETHQQTSIMFEDAMQDLSIKLDKTFS